MLSIRPGIVVVLECTLSACKQSSASASGEVCTSAQITVQCDDVTCAPPTPICCANKYSSSGAGACVAGVPDPACKSDIQRCDDTGDCPEGTVCCIYGSP